MKQIAFTLILLLPICIFSQDSFNTESYSVSAKDIGINVFEKDSTANAVVIYEYGNSYIDN